MWEIRLNHPGLNKFRVIKGQTQNDADQKAAMQVKVWDEQWQRVQQAYTKDQRKQLAEQQTKEAEEEISGLDTLLDVATKKDHRLDWSKLKDHTAYPTPRPREPGPIPTPVEPRIESFQPGLNWFSRLIPPISSKRKAEAQDRFRVTNAEWQLAMAKTEQTRMAQLQHYESELANWTNQKSVWLENQKNRNSAIDSKQDAYRRGEPTNIVDYCEMVLGASEYSHAFPSSFELDYIAETRVLVVDYSLPSTEALPKIKGYKYVATKNEVQPIAVTESWLNKTYDSVLYQIALRTLFELFQSDEAGALESVVFNGWVNSIDRANGKEVNACVITVQANKSEFLEINLAQVDPKACFKKLKGISASKLTALSPVRPILLLNREDKRFVPSHQVVDALDDSANLASMDWEEFEYLIRELFEKEFSSGGGEVKITQASRDGGVDAIVFDPDPIRGGKIVIQAKRYTNTVGVSAVRDLFGTIHNEGANKGILVTTADYGPDSYEFAKGKPITLLSGNELLFLLQKHGHKARIDLPEARRLAAEKG